MTRTQRTARRSAAFSITDLLVVMVVLVAMLALQLPSQAAARRTARRMQNSTQLRGIHQGLVTFANSNKNNFAGLNSKGQIMPDGDRETGSSGAGDFVQARFWIMFRGEFFTPMYAISPSEVEVVQEYDPGFDDIAAPVQWNDRIKHYSYAMLEITESFPRRAEWKQTLNSQAIVLSDRNTGSNATGRVESIHTGDPGDWRGSVLWNDNHVAFENEQYFETKYGNGQLNRSNNGDADNLFADANVGFNADGPDGSNGLMIIADNDIVHARRNDLDENPF